MRASAMRTPAVALAMTLAATIGAPAAMAHGTHAHGAHARAHAHRASHSATTSGSAGVPSALHGVGHERDAAVQAYHKAKHRLLLLKLSLRHTQHELTKTDKTAASSQRRVTRVSAWLQSLEQQLEKAQTFAANPARIANLEQRIARLQAKEEAASATAATPLATRDQELQANVTQITTEVEELQAQIPALQEAAEKAEASFRAAQASLAQSPSSQTPQS